jgi:hypothetical protein
VRCPREKRNQALNVAVLRVIEELSLKPRLKEKWSL